VSGLGEPRPFDRERDLGRVVRLMSDAHALRGDYLHPGGMQWWFRRTIKPDFRLLVWDDGPALAAWLMDDAGYVIARPARDDLASRLALVAWAERSLREMGRASIEVSAGDDEPALIDTLKGRGYTSSDSLGDLLVYDIDGRPPEPELPEGFRLTTLADVSDDEYIALHRAAWSSVKPSDYDRQLHHLVVSSPDFQRDMVPIVRAPGGVPAASCIAWFDAASLRVEIEPLGTHPDHRQRGLGKAIVRDVHRLAYERGARSVMVWGSHSNDAARKLYASAGMTPRRTVREYRRVL
jgi:mycothiol synthase